MFKVMWLILLLAAPAALAQGDELQKLREENARLRADLQAAQQRIEQLERKLGRTDQLEQQVRELSELAGVTPEGDRVESANARIEVVASDDGRSTVRSVATPLTITRGSRDDHYLTVAFSRSAQGSDDPVKLFVQTVQSGRVYLGQDSASFMVDGEEITLPISDYERRSRVSASGKSRMDRSNETFAIAIPDDQLARFAAARTIVGQIGHIQFVLDPDQTALIRAMQKRRSMPIGANP